MSLVALSSVADVIRGVSFSKDEGQSVPSENFLPVIRAGSIQDSLLLDEGQIWVPKNKVKEHQKIRRDDIVMCTSSGSSDLVGKCAKSEIDFEGSFGAFCAGIRPDKEKVSASYLYHFLSSPIFRNWTSTSSGANIKNIRISELAEFQIPLPPLAEQNRIAAILDKADAIRRKRQQAIQLADEFLRATFLDMFGDPVTNPKGWSKQSIGDVTFDTFTWNPLQSERDIPFEYIDLSSVDNTRKEITHTTTITAHSAPSRARQLVKSGDVLVSTVRPNLNGVAKVHEDREHLTASTGYCLLRPNQDLVTQNFLFYTVTSNSFINEMVNRASGANYPAVSNQIVKSFEIELPPRGLLDKFEEVCNSVNRHIAASHSFEAEPLFQSLSQKAFSGDL